MLYCYIKARAQVNATKRFDKGGSIVLHMGRSDNIACKKLPEVKIKIRREIDSMYTYLDAFITN